MTQVNSSDILKNYLRRLTNLRGNNRSLLLLRLPAEQLIDLFQFSFLEGKSSFEIIRSMIGGKAQRICPLVDSRMESANTMSRQLKRLHRIERVIFEERGTRDLHIGWPMVRGKFLDGTPARCPLLFLPVALVEESGHWKIELREDAGITFNKSFLLAYSFYNKIKLGDDFIETSFDDFDKDSTVFKTQLYQLLKDKLEINFNSQLFADEVLRFEDFKKEDFERDQPIGELKLFPEAVLGIFPQSGSQLVPDYLQLIEESQFNDFNEFFESKQIEATEQPVNEWVHRVAEEKIYTPFTLDAWQEHAVRLMKDGRSVVVQGPPGTGKSQLIANLMADAIASGKRALLVCQKRVALDVVYERLKKIALADFVGLVHDFRNDRREIFSKIAAQIDRIEDFKARNRSLDAIQLERRFVQVSRGIDQITEELEEYKRALFSEQECGASIKELYLTSDVRKAFINLKQEYQFFDFNVVGDFIKKLKRYCRFAENFERDSYEWKNRKSFSNYGLSDLPLIEETVRDISLTQQKIKTDLANIVGTGINLEECENLLPRQRDAESMLSFLSSDRVYSFFIAMIDEKDDETSLLWLQNMERVSMNCFDGIGVEVSLDNTQIGRCQQALQERIKTRRNLFRYVRWELFSENKIFLKRVLINNGLKYNKHDLYILEQRIDNRLNLEHHLTALKTKLWLQEIPSATSKDELKVWFTDQIKAVRAKLLFSSLRELNKIVRVDKFSRESFQHVIRSIFTIISTIPFHRNDWQKYLSNFQITHLINTPLVESNYIKSLHQDFDKLCEYDKLRESLSSIETDIVNRLADHLQSWNSDQIVSLFDNSIRLAWIEYIENKFPVLRHASTFRIDELQGELIQFVEEKQKLIRDIVLLRARDRTYEHVEYNRLNNRVTYRELYHQVTKRRNIWPVRKVISTFQDELFDLVPCWMASPESVSALFPMKPIFDIVIFDEASQCFAEQGIPAMIRGKQVLVAGDDKQLKPFELYQVRWNEESDHPDIESDSLLNLASRYLPSIYLQGHYRSKSPELIAFSNQHFYEQRLMLLPDRSAVQQHEPFINFIKVDGIWEDQVNLIEAQHVVDQIEQLLAAHPDKDIGVVTFNAPQQSAILDLLDERGLKTPDNFFVKNIENVQGDEKDIIIFSIAYAPDKKGKMSMLFGSLSMAGGENRLNVAVTRAREKIIVVSSIEPGQLRVDEATHDGPKLLKKYLQFAQAVSNKTFALTVPIVNHHAATWFLTKQLTQVDFRNTDVQLQESTLPFADIVVRDKENALGLILTDDSYFYNSLTVKEPFAFTPILLQQKNWPGLRVHTRNQWLDQAVVKHEVEKFIFSTAGK